MSEQGGGGQRALDYRDALFSLRQSVPAADKQRIDAILLPALETDFKAGKLRQGRHSLDKMLTAFGPESNAMMVSVLADGRAVRPDGGPAREDRRRHLARQGRRGAGRPRPEAEDGGQAARN